MDQQTAAMRLVAVSNGRNEADLNENFVTGDALGNLQQVHRNHLVPVFLSRRITDTETP